MLTVGVWVVSGLLVWIGVNLERLVDLRGDEVMRRPWELP